MTHSRCARTAPSRRTSDRSPRRARSPAGRWRTWGAGTGRQRRPGRQRAGHQRRGPCRHDRPAGAAAGRPEPAGRGRGPASRPRPARSWWTSPPDDAEHGRGLLITFVAGLGLGCRLHRRAKRVWLRFDRERRRRAARAPVGARPGDGAERRSGRRGRARRRRRGDRWNDDADARCSAGTADEVRRAAVRRAAWTGGRGPTTPGSRPTADLARGVAGHLLPAAQSDQPVAGVRLPRRARARPGGSTVLLVADRPAGAARAPGSRGPGPRRRAGDPLGLRGRGAGAARRRDYLMLAVERVRDRLSADAAYLLLPRDLDDEYEVMAVSGLSATWCGTRLAPGAPGAPDPRTPHLPVRRARPREDDGAAARRHRAPLAGGRPVVAEGRVVGALGVASDHVDGFSTTTRACSCSGSPTRWPWPTDRARLQAAGARAARLAHLPRRGRRPAGRLARPGHDDGDHRADRRAPARHLVRGPPRRRPRPSRPAAGVARGRAAGRAAAGPRCEAAPRRPSRRSPADQRLAGRGARHAAGRARPADRPPDPRPAARATRCAASPSWSPSRSPDGPRWRSTTPGRTASCRPIGEALQRSLLPSSMPEAPGLDVGVVYEAAGEASTGRRRLLRPVPGRRRDVVLRGRRRVRHRSRGGGGHRAGPAHDPGPGARRVPGRRRPRAAQRGDPRRGRAVPVPHPGLRDAASRRAAGARLEHGQRGTPAAVPGRRDGRGPRRSAAPSPCSASSSDVRYFRGAARLEPRRPARRGHRRRAGAARRPPHARRGGARRRARRRSATSRPRRSPNGSAGSSWSSPEAPQRDDMAILAIRMEMGADTRRDGVSARR